ncbi:hypothetical protein Tco_1454477, partial [Tanacetum coccineum]
YRCARMELITLDLICPSTYQLLWNSGGDSGPDLSFDKSASLERLFSLARVSLAKASKPDLSFGCSGGDYTSSCPPSLIPYNLHPRIPLEDFMMSKLPNDAIGIYHRMFDFSSVQIPFSSFLLDLIKHYRVHLSQLGPLGLNKVITFKVLCRSLQIELMMTLFRVFQTLCKLYDWFSFAKRRASFPFCINDNLSCMKHWKIGFFLIDRQAIPIVKVWRHPDAAIDDLRPAAGSFNMADIRRLSAHVADGNVMGIHDFLYLPEWTGAEVQKEPYLDVRGSCYWYPSSKIVAKAKASQKRNSSTSSATLSHVAKRTSDADDDDACFEISLVTPLRSATVIPSSGNQGGSFAAPTTEGSNPRDSQGKGIMVDDAATPSAGASRLRPSSILAPSFRDVSSDVIHTDFFPFSASPYYATYPEDGVAGNCK